MACKLPSGCKNDVFKELDYCALHCSDEEVEGNDIDDYLKNFSNLFMVYLFEKLKSIDINKKHGLNDFVKNTILSNTTLSDLMPDKFEGNEDLKDIINYRSLYIDSIYFPSIVGSHIIKEFKKVYFVNCAFKESLVIDESCVFYSSCTFHEKIEIKADTEYLYTKDKKDINYSSVNSSPNEDEDEYKYKECVFKSDVSIIGQKKINYIYYRLFRNCDFKKNINIDNIKARSDFITISDILEYIKIVDGKYSYKDLIHKYKSIYSFNDISIKNCNFDSSFKINGIDIDYMEKNRESIDKYNKSLSNEIKGIFSINSLIIEETKFDKKFELKNYIVNNFNFEDSNIKGIFDVYKSSFVKARFYKSIFEEFAAFEYVVFGNGNMDNRTDFIYVTFKDFSNFRDTHFKSGLSFSRANMKQEPNFLNTDINLEGIDRETLRIVKNSFEKNNNKIEAGKYHAQEMSAYIDELSFRKNFWQLVVLYLNKLISRFGQSYIIPFALLVGFVSLYSYSLTSYKKSLQFRTYELPYGVECITEWLNTIARNFLPFARFISDKRGFEFVSLFFYIIFAILIWQIIVAVKKQTQH